MYLFLILLFIQKIFCTLDLDCLIIFGDSLSDPGNLYNLTLKIRPDKRYYHGRYTNGPVWSEYIQDYINVKKVENWAYAGATTDNRISYKYRMIPSLQTQIDWFKLKNNSCYNSKPSKHLVVYMAGSNNYLNATVSAQQTVSSINSHLNTLINDLKFTNIFLTNLPPIHDTPTFTGKFLKTGEYSKNYHNDTQIKSKVYKHNNLLSELIATKKQTNPEVNIINFNFDKFWPKAKSLNPYSSANWSSELPCFDGSKDPEGCKNPEDYFFFDTNHPITEVHRFLV
ncbi:hypothetical protein CONCODRAFT_73679 [Conidiobolus coronatus NRRL 28638]|uniref:Carbohydrate esterase family 16 protein n=1 Tax=Conidiobolus coronatus (strain ATCC 28846 / CBS 209.66 / NRRL 28638) TaxID=796925 RepID=A0A137NUQ3_CONC2|nr:hypothetical protein CONCODRAFT_73679 [Conidiobolus coronatus NRRL 28638]|eukprot:KXN66452.1 hypothetical protein CONCODRAFT_73679 [Conidiobolus coronatus NRRL 28638]